MNKICTIIFLVTSLLLCPCCDSPQDRFVNNFDKTKDELEIVIYYIDNKYLKDDKIKYFNNVNVILENVTEKNRNIISDSLVTHLLKKYKIQGISFHKQSMCENLWNFDLVKFKIETTEIPYQYYYVYEFCPLNQDAISNNNFSSTPLNGNWSLQVEKN